MRRVESHKMYFLLIVHSTFLIYYRGKESVELNFHSFDIRLFFAQRQLSFTCYKFALWASFKVDVIKLSYRYGPERD